MKKQFLGVLFFLSILMGSCSHSFNQESTLSGESSQVAGEIMGAKLTYKTIFDRENFLPPRKNTDYEIDYAMRMGIFPTEDEPKNMPSDFFFLKGKMNVLIDNLEKSNVETANRLISELIGEFGLTWWLVERSNDLGPFAKDVVREALQDSTVKKSTYCKLALIKESRIKSGKWNP